MFLDQASDCDSVEHPNTRHVINRNGVGPNFIRHIQTLYHKARGLIKVQEKPTDSFTYERVVHEGSSFLRSMLNTSWRCDIYLQEHGFIYLQKAKVSSTCCMP